jgi:hypothetical protein
MIDQALNSSCSKLSAFMLSRSHCMGMPLKLDNHAMIPAKVPLIPLLQNIL